jgi:hypothetical protein
LGLPTEPPKVHPARASPEQEEFAFAEQQSFGFGFAG